MASGKNRIKSEFIRRLDLALLKNGISEDKDLAQRARISAPSISGWRRTDSWPRQRHLEDISAVLNVSPEWLLGDSDLEPNWEALRGNPLRINEEESAIRYSVAPQQWRSAPTDRLENLLEQCVEEKNYGAVAKVADELLNRKIQEKLK